jgi:calcineurin-like phosphoesterase family protein
LDILDLFFIFVKINIDSYTEIYVDKIKVILSHYPLFVWNKHHRGAIHLHGHCHGSLLTNTPEYYNRKVMDVGCMLHNYTPVNWLTIKEKMEEKQIIKLDHHGFDRD